MPDRELSEKEITQMNTEINAGGSHRRNSSNPRGSMSRRQSSQSGGADGGEHEESGQRLKWDEANLYLNEGQMGGKMKIDEPKTPYAKQYEPEEDDEEIDNINAQEIAVDELDMEKGKPARKSREVDIPGLDLGEPEMDLDRGRRESDGEKRVLVNSDDMDVDGARHGEDEEHMTSEEKEKHRAFEAMRKKHYEMKNIKNLLGSVLLRCVSGSLLLTLSIGTQRSLTTSTTTRRADEAYAGLPSMHASRTHAFQALWCLACGENHRAAPSRQIA